MPASWDPPLSPNAWLRWEAVSSRLPAEADTVLEVGCGQGGFGARLARRYRYLGVEPDERSLAVARARVGSTGEVRHGDVSAVRPEERFDLVCAFEVLEHVEDDQQALEEWAGRLRPGGRLLVSAPAWQHRFAAADEMVGHFRRYDPASLERMLRVAGLEQVDVTLFGAPFGYLLEAVRNTIGRVRRGRTSGQSLAERTAGSGRLLQPPEGVLAAAVYLGVLPFRKLERVFPGRGPGVLGMGTRPSR
jgi:SAM-dependent methyltransferase